MKRGRLIYDLFKEFGKETNSLSCYYVACVVLILLLQLKVIHSHLIKLICRLNSYYDIELPDNNTSIIGSLSISHVEMSSLFSVYLA